MLSLSEGGALNIERVGAFPLLSMDLIVKIFVLPSETVELGGNAVNEGAGFAGSVILKKKSIGIYYLLSPLLLSKSSTIITATQRLFNVPLSTTLSLTSQVTKPEVLNVIPVGL